MARLRKKELRSTLVCFEFRKNIWLVIRVMSRAIQWAIGNEYIAKGEKKTRDIVET